MKKDKVPFDLFNRCMSLKPETTKRDYRCNIELNTRGDLRYVSERF